MCKDQRIVNVQTIHGRLKVEHKSIEIRKGLRHTTSDLEV
jgi:hypothetical protein